MVFFRHTKQGNQRAVAMTGRWSVLGVLALMDVDPSIQWLMDINFIVG